jgi:hypothetical protein
VLEWKLVPRKHFHAPVGCLQGSVKSFRSQGNKSFQTYGHTTLVPLDWTQEAGIAGGSKNQ